MTLPILNPEFDQPLEYLKIAPRTMAEARELAYMLAGEAQAIQDRLADKAYHQRFTPAGFIDWERRAKRALHVKRQQLHEAHLWRKARTPHPVAPEAGQESKAALRRAAHVARFREFLAQSGVGDPRDPDELLALARRIIGRLAGEGAALLPEEEAAMSVINEYQNMHDGHGALVR